MNKETLEKYISLKKDIRQKTLELIESSKKTLKSLVAMQESNPLLNELAFQAAVERERDFIKRCEIEIKELDEAINNANR